MSIYVGVAITSATITESNVSKYFTSSNGSYTFVQSGGTLENNNKNIDLTRATITLTAKQTSSIRFDYGWGSEANYDKFTIVVAGTTVISSVSGTGSNSQSGTISKGQTISLTYSKDGSGSRYGDYAQIYNVVLSGLPSAIVPVAAQKLYFGLPEGGGNVVVQKAYIGDATNTPRLWYSAT